jgi:hypothetical protein
MTERKEMVCSNKNLREENYLSYLYFKFYFMAGHVGSLRKTTSFVLGCEDRRRGVNELQVCIHGRDESEWTAGWCKGQEMRSE